MKKILTVLLAASVAVLLCACSGPKDEQSSSTESKQQSTASESTSSQSSKADKSSEDINPASSSAEKPLELKKWGKAAKYSTEENGYVSVPVRILSVRRGESVANEVKRLAEKNIFTHFSEPEDFEEYAIAEYELSLDCFPVGKGGTNIDITAFIVGTDDDMLTLKDGTYWSATAMSLNEDDKYCYEGVVRGTMAFKIPKGVSDYIIKTGEAGEEQAYFKGV